MCVFREQQRFPTRNYPYRTLTPEEQMAEAAPAAPPTLNTLYRRVVGLDQEPKPMTAAELELLEDPFGRLLRSGKQFPLTLRDALKAIDGLDGANALPAQLVFLVADGGHIAWTPETNELERSFRFALARGKGEFPLLISSSTAVDSTANSAFLQILGWDAKHEVFHYYERLNGTFFWAGMSPHALEDGTRGKGPFDSHVNGSMVMKELRPPWLHWHAPQAGINAEALAPNDHLRDESLFKSRVTADRLEIEVVRPGIRRWNEARVRKAVEADGVWRNVCYFLRQAVTDTTVNLASSDAASDLLTDNSILRPPLSFFINRDTLFDSLGLVPDHPAVADIRIQGRLYRECLKRFDVHRTDGRIRVEGDSHFAFLTPEPAFEDTHLVDASLQAGLLTPRFVASLSMTDFTNPVFSSRRAALLKYVPKEIRGPNVAENLENQFVEKVTAAIEGGENNAQHENSPEREFVANWKTADFEASFIKLITQYFQALQQGMADEAVVDGWFRLVEHRRRRFRRRRLAEFSLTTPRTNIPEDAPALTMTRLGKAEPIL
jgi:hypothetical protein